jgi:hypothetical protein
VNWNFFSAYKEVAIEHARYRQQLERPLADKIVDVFNTFAVRYDKWYDRPFGKSAFNLEEACITSLSKGL